MKSVIQLLRPQQWVKNFFVFLPVFFDGKLTHLDLVLMAICVFFAYSFASSGIYCLNDIYDVESDRRHPKKRLRPIASGKISKLQGYGIMAACFAVSFFVLAVSFHGEPTRMLQLMGVIALYVVMNIAYCLKLKKVSIIDVFIISLGFVLRIVAGGCATGIVLSHWIVLMTFLLALFLAFAKRRDDVAMFERDGVEIRDTVSQYNLAFINQALGIVASITMVCYIMYTVSPEIIARFHSKYVYVTSIFVLAGIIRYLQLTIVDVKSGSPTKVLLKDRFIQACVLGWGLTFACILYL